MGDEARGGDNEVPYSTVLGTVRPSPLWPIFPFAAASLAEQKSIHGEQLWVLSSAPE